MLQLLCYSFTVFMIPLSIHRIVGVGRDLWRSSSPIHAYTYMDVHLYIHTCEHMYACVCVCIAIYIRNSSPNLLHDQPKG